MLTPLPLPELILKVVLRSIFVELSAGAVRTENVSSSMLLFEPAAVGIDLDVNSRGALP
jgi:hypothetical protein